MKSAGWHVVFHNKCAGELEIFQVLLLCVDLKCASSRLGEILLVTSLSFLHRIKSGSISAF